MKPLLILTTGVVALLAGGCVGAEPAYTEQPVPVAVAPVAPPPPSEPGPDQPPPPPAVAETAQAPASATQTAQSVEPLDQIVAPIALYPDVLVALILPASTVSSDVVLAARYLAGGGDPQQVDAQPWDDSVKGLTHYPEVVKWMDENLAWTQQLGAVYLDNQGNVMNAIQRVRAEARAKGLLADTPQQQVVMEGSTIEIIPAQPDVIYVPRYDPEVIFVDRPVFYETDPWLTFGVGFGVGWWLSYDFDWNRRVIWIDRHSRDHWHDHHDWRQPHYVGGGGVNRGPDWQTWHPSPNRPRPPHRDFDHGRRPIAHPAPLPGTPHHDFGHHDGRQPDHARTPAHDQPGHGRDNNPAPNRSADPRRDHPARPENHAAPAPRPPRADRVAPPATPVPAPHQEHEPDDRRSDRKDDSANRAQHPVPSDNTARVPRGEQPNGATHQRQEGFARNHVAPASTSPAATAPAPQERPRLQPQRPERTADRVAPAPVVRSAPPAPAIQRSAPAAAPAIERARAMPRAEERRSAPAMPRQERHADRTPRAEAPRVAPPPAPASRANQSDNNNSGRGRDDRREQEK